MLLSVLEVIVGLSNVILGVLLLFHVRSALRATIGPCSQEPAQGNVAIMIPFFNEPHDTLIDALNAIEQQDYLGRIEIILVDDGSTNDTSVHVRRWLAQRRHWRYHLEVLERNGGRKGKALDIAMGLVSRMAEVVTVIDSDTLLAPSALQRAMDVLLQDERNVACCGLIIPMQRQGNLVEKLQYYEHTGFLLAVKHAQSKIGKVAVIAGAFSLHRTWALKELGGWGQWLVEDVAWTWKALANGYRIVYAEDAIAYTVCPSSFTQLFRQRRRWARGKVEAVVAAWQTSRWQSVLLMPWTLLWGQISFLPCLLIAPALAWVPGSSGLVVMVTLNVGLMIVLYLLAHKRDPNHRRVARGARISAALKATACNLLFDVINIPANLLGVVDGVCNRPKAWLTRLPHGAGNSASSPNDADAST